MTSSPTPKRLTVAAIHFNPMAPGERAEVQVVLSDGSELAGLYSVRQAAPFTADSPVGQFELGVYVVEERLS